MATYATLDGLRLEVRVDPRFRREMDDGMRDVSLRDAALYPERGDDPITIFLEMLLVVPLISTHDPHGRVIYLEFDAAKRPVVYDTRPTKRGG